MAGLLPATYRQLDELELLSRNATSEGERRTAANMLQHALEQHDFTYFDGADVMSALLANRVERYYTTDVEGGRWYLSRFQRDGFGHVVWVRRDFIARFNKVVRDYVLAGADVGHVLRAIATGREARDAIDTAFKLGGPPAAAHLARSL